MCSAIYRQADVCISSDIMYFIFSSFCVRIPQLEQGALSHVSSDRLVDGLSEVRRLPDMMLGAVQSNADGWPPEPAA